MADNKNDPAGSTQMFRAFVDEGAVARAQRASSGNRTGVIVAVVATAVVIGAVLWFTLS